MLCAQYTYDAIGSKYYYWLLYLWIMKFSQRCFENVTLCGKQICIIIGRFWCTYVCKLTVVFCCGWNSRFKQRPWFFFIVVERVPISNQSLETQFQKLKEKKSHKASLTDIRKRKSTKTAMNILLISLKNI